MTPYRPWGPIDWLLGRLGDEQWSLIACCGTEERSLSLACYLSREKLRNASILRIRDPEPLDVSLFDIRLREQSEALQKYGYTEDEIHSVELLGIDAISNFVTSLVDGGATRLIIDITSLPKLWFFPIVRAALSETRLNDIVVTYTSAISYADQLSENVAPLRVLPGFFAEDGRSRHDSLIVGIGFEPLGLVPLLSDQKSDKIRLIFPFPPGPPGHRKNWMFVKQIEELTLSQEIEPPDRVHIHMYDCPQVFDALCEMTNMGKQTAAIAPYGPKTVSLAMCLYALAVDAAGLPKVPVYYAQPKRYALDYTTGVRMRGALPDITGYCLRLAGRDLYTIAIT